jgi:hypothetical protein
MRFLLLILFTISFLGLQAQGTSGPRFKAGLIAGINAAQLRGDESTGFKKLGLTGGISGIAVLDERMDLIVEILYSQRGSTQQLIAGSQDQIQKYFLNYIEVPVLFGIKDWYNQEREDYNLQFYGGLSYGRLIDGAVNFSAEHRELLTDNEDTPDEIDSDRYIIDRNADENDISWILGATYFINDNWAASFRYTSSFNFIWKLPDDPGPDENFDSLRSFFLSFRLMYLF